MKRHFRHRSEQTRRPNCTRELAEGMRAELQNVLKAVTELPPEELPRLLGELEEVRCTAMARLTMPAPVQGQSDELLDVAEVSRRLGLSRDYLYRHHSDFPFTRRVGRKLLFSALGIERYIKQQSPLDSKKAKTYL
jgi:hypothetical protein